MKRRNAPLSSASTSRARPAAINWPLRLSESMPLRGDTAALALELDDGRSRALFARRLPAGCRATSRVLFSCTRVPFGFRTDSLRVAAVRGTGVDAGWVSKLSPRRRRCRRLGCRLRTGVRRRRGGIRRDWRRIRSDRRGIWHDRRTDGALRCGGGERSGEHRERDRHQQSGTGARVRRKTVDEPQRGKPGSVAGTAPAASEGYLQRTVEPRLQRVNQ